MTAQYWIPQDKFGDRLLIFRRRQKLTTRELALAIGVSHKSISYWEQGSKPKNLDEIVTKIANVYRVHPNWLMYGENGPVGLAGLEPATERLHALGSDPLMLII